jgi:NAD(P)-dependent dehydrogenase (short-subunit alcohol dehydrogenase family)
MTSVIVCGTGPIADAIGRALRDTGHDVVVAADSNAVEHIVTTARGHATQVAALVNVPPGGPSCGTILQTPEAAWDETIARDLTAVFRASKAVLPYFIERGGGAIVNLAASSGYGRAGQLAESAGHGAIIAFGAALAYDHFNDRVRVNTIVTGESATPEAIAPVAAFLLSSDADVLSGSLIDVGNAAYQGGASRW